MLEITPASLTFNNTENDDYMKRDLAAIESESENAYRRYQQLLGFKRLVSSIDENEILTSKMMVSLPG